MNLRRAASILLDFMRIEAIACSFAFSLIGCLAITNYARLPFIPRYDFVFLFCLVFQGLLIWRKIETWRDIAVISVFHVVGVMLEWYKVNAGSWSYPEFTYLKFFGVPLYGGFMYAAIASYMIAAWKLFDLRFIRWPTGWVVGSLMVLVYGQFFIPLQALAVRFAVLAILCAVFSRCWVEFTVSKERLGMPAPVALLLIGFFVWLAENIATYFGAWTYPTQVGGWQPVHLSKVVSWTMLMVVSLTIIQTYKSSRWALNRVPEPQVETV